MSYHIGPIIYLIENTTGLNFISLLLLFQKIVREKDKKIKSYPKHKNGSYRASVLWYKQKRQSTKAPNRKNSTVLTNNIFLSL